GRSTEAEMPLDQALAFLSKDTPISIQGTNLETYLPSNNLYIPVDKQRVLSAGLLPESDTANIISKIPVTIDRQYITKDQLAVLDVLMSNFYDRPIYFSVTCQESKLMNLNDYM